MMKNSTEYIGLPIKEIIPNLIQAFNTHDFATVDLLYHELDSILSHTPRGADWAIAMAWRGKIRITFHGNPLEGLEDALNAFYYFREVGDEQRMSVSHIDIANCYMKFGLFEKVIEHLGAACILSKKMQRYDSMISSLIRLADAHGNLGNYEQALRFCREALDTEQYYGVQHDTAFIYMSMAQAYQGMQKITESFEAIQKAISVATEEKNIRAAIYAYNIESALYLSIGEHKKALVSIAACERYTKQAAAFKHFYPVLMYKCACLLEMGKLSQAYTTALDILNANQGRDALFEARICEVLARICTSKGETKEARRFQKKHDEFMLRHAGDSLKHKVRALTIDFNAQRYQMEAQLERERAQQLEGELALREKELTVLALNLAQKNEMLMSIEQKIHALEKTLSSVRKSVQAEMGTVLSNVKSDITSSVQTDKSWEVFEQQFITIHPGFVERLSQKHPNFKPMELRLCALLKVNLSTKQIANILCIDSKSVDVYRSRIRRKIQMVRSGNLMTYLAGI